MNRLLTSHLVGGVQASLLLAGIIFIARQGHAQQPAGRLNAVNEPLTITKDWDKDREEMRQFEAMYRGERPVTTDEDRAILDNGAKWYAYRLTHLLYQESTGRNPMHELVKQAVSKVVDPHDTRRSPNANQLTFKEEYDKRLISRLSEVMKNPKPIARVNAAMILTAIAATGQEAVIDTLLEIVQDPQENEGVKLYALRGLTKFFETGQGETPFKSQDHEAKAVRVLLDYVQRKPAKDAWTPSEAAAHSYIRNEAVTALGLTRYPAHSTIMKKVVTIDRMTALALLRIIRKDGILPEPSPAEQINAVVSLSQLQARRCDEYQIDYAAYHVGRFIQDFLAAYNNRENLPFKLEWKVAAARLYQALDDLKTQAERGSAKAYVAKLALAAQAQLKQVIDGKNPPESQALNTYLDNNQPTNKTLFKDRPDTVVKEVENPAE